MARTDPRQGADAGSKAACRCRPSGLGAQPRRAAPELAPTPPAPHAGAALPVASAGPARPAVRRWDAGEAANQAGARTKDRRARAAADPDRDERQAIARDGADLVPATAGRVAPVGQQLRQSAVAALQGWSPACENRARATVAVWRERPPDARAGLRKSGPLQVSASPRPGPAGRTASPSPAATGAVAIAASPVPRPPLGEGGAGSRSSHRGDRRSPRAAHRRATTAAFWRYDPGLQPLDEQIRPASSAWPSCRRRPAAKP